jgi:formylglycine-generating enzyme required for sulfatase activity
MPQLTAKQFSGIFVSYRRDDSGGHAGRLYDRLTTHFGEDQIFMDIDQIEPGEDFVQVIEDAVGSCGILLALIGRSWLTSRDEAGRRLDNPKDFVRLEIAIALNRDIRVIPVLVQGALMPRLPDLPEDLSSLSRRQALELSDLRWRHDVDQLIGTLEKTLARQREARRNAQEEAERQQREAEAQRQAEESERRTEESERRKQAAAETMRQAWVAGVAERDRQAARERERSRDVGRASVTGEETPPVTGPQVTSMHSTGVLLPGAQPKPTARLMIIVIAASILIVIGTALAVWWKPTPSEKVLLAKPSPTAEHPNIVDITQVPPGMVYVPGGEFQMGNNAGDEYEKPAHTVTVKPFYIDQYEVTNEEYAKFVKETGHKPPQMWKDGTYPNGEARRPVTGVTWDDANDYAKWAGKRLPTEEEWEFAARGKDGLRYPWGNEWRAGLANADHASNGMVDVGSYPGKSPFGVFDMVGNAWEWTASKFRSYSSGQLPRAAVSGEWKVIRGGTYLSSNIGATTTFRRGWPANGYRIDYSNTGFRCAKDATK